MSQDLSQPLYAGVSAPALDCPPRHIGAFHWRPLKQIPPARRPGPALCRWLADRGSLTAALMVESRGQFRVRVLRQWVAVPEPHEQRALGMKRPVRALIREVILEGCGQPWVFARSLLPLTSLSGSLRHLRKQDSRPLGAFLFRQPDLQRRPIEVLALVPAQQYLPPQLFVTRERMASGRLWGRRSVFSLETKPLLVSEVFLPDFCARLTAPAQSG